MKILHIAPSYWPAFKMGGPTQSVHVMNRYLVKGGADVTVFTTNASLEGNNSIELNKEVLTDGVKVFYFPYYGYIHYTFSPGLFVALWKNMKKFDLVHITGVWNFPVSAAAFWARFYKIPYIISPRGSLMKEPLAKKNAFWKKIYLSLIGERDLKNAAFIHFTSDAERNEYVHAGFPFRLSTVISNSFDVESFEKQTSSGSGRIMFPVPPDAKIVLFLGRLSWKKGFDTLIPAYQEVLKSVPDAFLVIAGGDEEEYGKIIRSIMQPYDILPRVYFTGMLLGAQKTELLKHSAVFVLPSYSENFGMAVAEAMYSKIPVVVTKGVGIAPDIERAGAGIVVEKNPHAVSSAIIKILTGAVSGDMGERGKKLVETKFSATNVAEQMAFVYDGLVRAK